MTAWLLLLYGITAASAGFNAQYFWAYQTARRLTRARRLAALALALLHGALFLENAYFSAVYLLSDVLSLSAQAGGSLVVGLSPVLWLPLRAFIAAATVGVTLLLLRSPSTGNRKAR